MNKIVVIEDDKLLNSTLCFNLKMEGYEVETFSSYSEATKGVVPGLADLLIVDVNLGDGNGFELVKSLNPDVEIPIIFLTANDMESDMLKGYELGAEDYVTKPFSMPIFLKKCAVIMKRLVPAGGGVIYDDGFLKVNFDAAAVTVAGADALLTPLELRMLNIFIRSGGIVLTRNVLMDRLWDSGGNFVDEHTLTTNINRLRGKIENKDRKYIKTVYGMGYMWIVE